MTQHVHSSVCGLCTTRLKDVSVSYKGEIVLEHVSFDLHCGQITALIGPNGAGKSTLMRALIGLIPCQGSISFEDAHAHPSRAPRIGYVPQTLSFDKGAPLSVGDLFSISLAGQPVFMPIAKKRKDRAISALSRVGGAALYDKRLGDLSGGELKRVLLALALVPAPDVLLLDEPEGGMDTMGMEAFLSVLADIRDNEDLTVLLITHEHGLLTKYVDNVALIDKRLLGFGTPEEIFVLEEYANLFRRRRGEAYV